MFTKTALVKFALVPLAAMTLLAQVASASSTALQHRQDNDTSSDDFWPPPPDDCRPGRSHLPKIVKPDRDTVWRVGEWRVVRWEKRRDGSGRDGDSKDDKDDEGGSRCKPWLVLLKRHGDNFRPIVLTTNFELDDGPGSVEVAVPNVRPDDDYAVVLYLGRLQSRSDRFKIKKRND